jgi:serine phosphatase RsbU (regulator of sigma subunit)
MRSYNEPATPIGLQPLIKPIITELPVTAYTYVVVFTDGLLRAGERIGRDLELGNYLSGWPASEGRSPRELTEALLRRALELDQGEPSDDMSIVTLAVLPGVADAKVRRLFTSAPFEPEAGRQPASPESR